MLAIPQPGGCNQLLLPQDFGAHSQTSLWSKKERKKEEAHGICQYVVSRLSFGLFVIACLNFGGLLLDWINKLQCSGVGLLQSAIMHAVLGSALFQAVGAFMKPPAPGALHARI